MLTLGVSIACDSPLQLFQPYLTRTQSYGVFLAHYLTNSTFSTSSRLLFAYVGGLSISQALLISPLATLSISRLGTRPTLLIGVFFQTVALIAASFTKTIWQLFLSQGVCFGWGMGFLFVASVGIVPQWFTTRRSLANGIAASGSGFGGLIYSLASNRLIHTVGLGWAFRVLGLVTFAVNTICALLLRDRNKQVGSRVLAFHVSLLRRADVWLLLGFGVFSMLGYVALLFSLPHYAERIGLSSKQGSVVGALLNLSQGLGRSPIGWLSDVFGRINTAAVMSSIAAALALFVWVWAKTYGVSTAK